MLAVALLTYGGVQLLVQKLLQCLIRIDQAQARTIVCRLVTCYVDMLKAVGGVSVQVCLPHWCCGQACTCCLPSTAAVMARRLPDQQRSRHPASERSRARSVML